MDGVMVIFVVVFVPVLAAICALQALRMQGSLELPESPPFPLSTVCQQPVSHGRGGTSPRRVNPNGHG